MHLILSIRRHAAIIWFKHILFRRKGLGAAYNVTMPSPEEVFTKEPNHTHTHTHTYGQESKSAERHARQGTEMYSIWLPEQRFLK